MSPLRDYRCEKCGYTKEIFFHKESELGEICHCQCGGTKWKQMLPKFNFKVKNGTPIFHGGKE